MELRLSWRTISILSIVFTFCCSTSANKHRHHHGRGKRQHSPVSYVLDVQGPESGDWGPWSAPAPCSRTCGGGVSYQYRQCREDSRGPCEGASKRYFSCNIQDCPRGSISFRAEQCSNFNNVPFDDVFYTWVPYTKAPNKCELNCMPRGERFYYRHKDKVADGTRCDEEKLDVCVDGKCLPVGCDHLLGSAAREDQCRECGGDGSSCNTVRGLLDKDDLQVGYSDLLLIPAGATNIRVQETRPSNNYLAIRNVSGHYYLNGNWRIDFPRSIRACNTIFHYERKPQGFFAPEMISALGPISEPIYIVLLYQEKNPGIEYEYSIPKGAVVDTDPEGYSWVYNEFGPCSATCGGGVQTRNVWCAKRRDSAEVSRDLCNEALEPPAYQDCAPEPCAPQWTVSEWGPCTQSCGTGGTQTRQVICEQIISGGRGSLANSALCEDSLGPAPPSTQMCGEGPPCPSWHIGPWKPCDKLCGDGTQRREVVCFHKVDGKIEKMADGACPGEKPESEMPCKLRPCEGVDWVTTEWSGCEDKCGLAFETRQAFCTTEKGELYPDSFCHKSKVPELKRECNTTATCKHQWFAAQWSECSAQCGLGIQTRKVFCGTLTDEGVEKATDDKCDAALKYEDTKNCTGAEECKGNWFAGPWSACSKPCGGGQRSRKVLCMLNNETVPAIQCDLNVILFANEDCNNNACGTDQIITVAPEHKVYEDYDEDEDCDEDYDSEDFISTEGVEIFSTELEGSGSSPGIEDHSLVTSASDVSSFSSEGLMLSDEPSSLSPSGTSDTSLLVSFDSSDTTEESGTASPIWSTDGEGSGESALPSEATSQGSDVLADSSSEASSVPPASSEAGASEASSSDIEATTVAGEASSSGDESSGGVTTEAAESSSASEKSSDGLTSDVAEQTTLASATDDSSSASESASDATSDSESSSDPTETTPESSTPPSESSPTSEQSATDDSVSEDVTTADSSVNSSDKPEVTSEVAASSELVSEADAASSAASVAESESSTLGASEQSESATAESQAASDEVTSPAPSGVSDEVTGSSEEVGSSDVSSPAATESAVSGESTTVAAESSSEASGASSESSEGSSESSSVPPSGASSEAGSEGSSPSSLAVDEDQYSVTSPSYGGSTTELVSIFSPELTTAAKKAGKRKCKKRPKKKSACLTSEFGCCYDNTTAAQGPFNKGCPVMETCKDTKHGCCQDGVSPAKGRKYKGCPPSQCALSLFGCCPDGVSESQGNDDEGCPEEPTTPADTSCGASEFGCCPDGETAAQGTDNEGCDLYVTTEEAWTVEYDNGTDCENTTYGCCPDGIIAANGPEYEGCEGMEEAENCSETAYGCCPDGNTTAAGPGGKGCQKSCSESQFGCCEDNETPAHGPNKEGCCLLDKFGCCPDNILPAQGPSLEGCGCQYSTYGCCPDNKTVARGPDNQGCGCQYTPHGCCPDQYTPAAGPGYQGCPCYTYQFGCCPDGVTRAVGPNLQGCGCENTLYGCCPDGRTPASGPDRECPCVASKYGCCPDGVSEALGENFQNCQDIPLRPGELCTLQKDRGSCREFSVKWYYDTEYGGCSRFWYGGCDGNENRFATTKECSDKCIEPPGRDACFLPKIEGPCDGYYLSWYYDVERKQCGQFVYRGCLGNNNRFETKEQCDQLCVTPETLDACEKPQDAGPCKGNFTRWFYDKEAGACSTFNYGGCQGNNNNFQTDVACQQKCLQPGRSKVTDVCGLEKDPGPCPGTVMRWYYDSVTDTCRTFVYGGCQGNANRFRTEDECVNRCVENTPDECALPRASGTCKERLPRWYFDASENRCSPFYYTGCQGNGNNFDTREVCEAACPPKIEQHTCLLPALVGECHNYTARWYYDSLEAQCRQFYFGGCGGNNNNFLSQEECQRSCEGGYVPPPPPEQVYTAPPQPQPQPQPEPEQQPQQFTTDMCFLSDDAGQCGSSEAQWFYDSRDGVCKQFIYTGCGGNGNRFSTRQECEARCGNVQDLCGLPRVVGPCDGNELQYYYDQATDSCYTFDYGGCQGNANRFPTLQECEQRCRRAPPPPPPTSAPAPTKSDICYQPVDKGPCSGEMAAWFFDAPTGQCQTFVYGGCEGNANRFSSTEQCERQCGQFLHQDVCNVAADVGPCTQRLTKWYFDPATRTCQEFSYGGCEGSANRFSSASECESVCLHRQELIPQTNSSLSYLAICKLPIDSGPCDDAEFTRWAFDERQQTCVAFTYHGCAGNLNRFKSFHACLDYCLPGHAPVTAMPNVIDVDIRVEKERCEDVAATCASLTQCPYGVERWVDPSGCDNCRCYNPCVSADPNCPANMTCAIAPITNPQSGQTEYTAVCRELHKIGECPQLREVGQCSRECVNDADCSGTAKCCYNGCGASCLEPVQEVLVTSAPDTYHPGGSAPEIYAEAPDVEADEGYFVTLRCIARGNPTPSVSWVRGQALLSAVGGRYKFLTDGSLQIVGLTQSDSGDYVCQADNGVGEPARKTFHVRVRGPKDRQAEVLGDDSQSVVVSLGSRALLQCYAYGYPVPSVTWWRGERMLPFVSADLEQRRDFSLVLHTVTLTSLGPYTCQAYNGKGRAASWTVVLKAVGPVYAPDPNDVTYNQYLVPPPRSPPDHPHHPPYQPHLPRPQPTPPTTVAPTVRVYVVPVKTNISMDKSTFPVDSDISIPCDVDGYPLPKVIWYKDDQILHPSDKIQISESSRLTVVRASANDTGVYKCEAANQFSSSFSEVDISVEGIYVDPLCTDNTFFADCHLVVKGKYCTHKYYGKFCCKSCTLAGQLPSLGPHLDQLQRRRRHLTRLT